MTKHIDILKSLHGQVDAILRGNHSGWDAALSKIRDDLASETQPAAEEEQPGLSWTLPLPHLKNVQRVVQATGWGFLELEHIEQVLLADVAVIAVTTPPKVDLLTDEENAALFKQAEEVWTSLQSNDLGGFSGGNRPFWLLHEFKDVIEKFGGRDVGLHHSEDDLKAMGAVPRKPSRIWDTMSTAPHDGRWFLALVPGSLLGLGTPNRAIPDLKILQRHRSTPESDGYWMSIWGYSVADTFVSKALWAELDALPLVELYAALRGETEALSRLPYPIESE